MTTSSEVCDLELHWSTELDRLEIELQWAERLLKVAEPLDRAGWTPQQPLGPIPPQLHARAHDIARRQGDLQAQLAQALQQLAQERRYVAAPPPEQPRFVDVVG